jgi:hypothetical protein
MPARATTHNPHASIHNPHYFRSRDSGRELGGCRGFAEEPSGHRSRSAHATTHKPHTTIHKSVRVRLNATKRRRPSLVEWANYAVDRGGEGASDCHAARRSTGSFSSRLPPARALAALQTAAAPREQSSVPTAPLPIAHYLIIQFPKSAAKNRAGAAHCLAGTVRLLFECQSYPSRAGKTSLFVRILGESKGNGGRSLFQSAPKDRAAR